MKVAIAGASGFIGQLLTEELRVNYTVVALTRGSGGILKQGVEWRNCDLFSASQTETALADVEIAFYLVHSMLPTARLMQSNFENADLLLADNFARAAKFAGVKRIIYLGGLIPDTQTLSRHLLSRLEVEKSLGSQGCPVTSLRAGLVLGAEGSSFQMLFLLVKRLPILICPAWTKSRTQCIASLDAVRLLNFCLERPATTGLSYDIGAPDIVSYRQLMTMVAETMGLKRIFLSIPLFSPGLSRLWVQLITGASSNLVAPLVQSLQHEMLVRNTDLLKMYGKPLVSLADALKTCLANIRPTLRLTTKVRQSKARATNNVRSIQRLILPPGKSARWTAETYFQWLPRFFRPFILVEQVQPNVWHFCAFIKSYPLLILALDEARSQESMVLFHIQGGILVDQNCSPNARLEFHEVLDGRYVLVAIQDFQPALPWLIYKYTQAVFHLWVMRRFSRYLRKTSSK